MRSRLSVLMWRAQPQSVLVIRCANMKAIPWNGLTQMVIARMDGRSIAYSPTTTYVGRQETCPNPARVPMAAVIEGYGKLLASERHDAARSRQPDSAPLPEA